MEKFEVIEFYEQRDFSKKMNATYGFLKQNFKPFWRSMLFIAGPPIVISGIFVGDIFNRITGLSAASQGGNGAEQYFTSLTFWLQFAGVLIFLWVGGVITISTTYAYLYLYSVKRTNKITVSEVWAHVRSTFWMYFWTITLCSIFLFIMMMIAGVILMLFVGVVNNISPFISVVVVISFYLFSAFFLINVGLIFPAREFERLSFSDAIQRILILLKGKTWSTFGIGAMNFYVQYASSLIIFVPWYTIFFIMILHSQSTGETMEYSTFMKFLNSFFLTLYFLVSYLLTALPLLGLAFQYFNLVEMKESRGLMSRIESFGKSSSESDAHEDF
jgi:hypothetical protein